MTCNYMGVDLVVAVLFGEVLFLALALGIVWEEGRVLQAPSAGDSSRCWQSLPGYLRKGSGGYLSVALHYNALSKALGPLP